MNAPAPLLPAETVTKDDGGGGIAIGRGGCGCCGCGIWNLPRLRAGFATATALAVCFGGGAAVAWLCGTLSTWTSHAPQDSISSEPARLASFAASHFAPLPI